MPLSRLGTTGEAIRRSRPRGLDDARPGRVQSVRALRVSCAPSRGATVGPCWGFHRSRRESALCVPTT